ncbi:MAG TPA: methyl-accepting chemotaxis protein [Thermoleophilia bacterium]|nr:methyl-accepting chemotaxis protein [Thermoleophilia bacterium]
MTIMQKIQYGCWTIAGLLVVTGCVYVWGPAAFGSDTARIVVITLGVIAAVACIVFSLVLPRNVMGTIAKVVIDVTTASRQVLGAASQVTASAVETATAITQAATTVDEVRQTSLLANQKATDLCDVSRDGEATAETGRQAIGEIVDGMSHVRDQITAVAETVVRLSDQTKAADEIVQTTNMLAEQSNLLSVNAAIEAASAGEYGKGFGVVAEEIRNLATQSKQAAQQVRSILSDIGRATDAAVMATEQGTKTIELNLHRTADSSDAIEDLAGGVGRASLASQQIAASTQQQLVGMDQISQAMESINAAGAQNAIAARQMEGQAVRLDEAAANLARLIGFIKTAAPAHEDRSQAGAGVGVRAHGAADDDRGDDDQVSSPESEEIPDAEVAGAAAEPA